MLQSRRRNGFTLIEVLVVMAAIGILVAILLPAVQQARESARVTQCKNHLKQLGLALHNYESTFGVLPPSFIRQADGNPPPPPGATFGTLRYRSHWTGFHLLLPFIEERGLSDAYDFNGTWLSSMTDINDLRAWPLNRTVIPLLMCPSTPRQGTSIGSGTAGGGGPNVVAEVDDGGSFSGTGGSTSHWMSGAPTDYSFSHGADSIRALPGSTPCTGSPPHYWSLWPANTRGAFGYNSDCALADIRDGTSQTFLMGEKAGGLLKYGGWNPTFPKLSVEYPWAMAAVTYFAPTGGDGSPGGSFWVVGPFAVTQDIRFRGCPNEFAEQFPINPAPRDVPLVSNERPFYSFQSAHQNGAHFLFGDGSVRFLNNSINQNVYRALSTINGGESFSAEQF